MNIQAGNKYITKYWYRYQVMTIKAIFSSLVICDVCTIGDDLVTEQSVELDKITDKYYQEYSEELYRRVLFVNTVQNDVAGVNSYDAEELWTKGYRKVEV